MRTPFTLLLVLITAMTGLAQSTVLRGIVTDDEGLSLAGANLTIQDLNKGAVTDVDGRYIFQEIPAGTYAITVSYIGYTTYEGEVTVSDGETNLYDVSLVAGVYIGEEVLVLGDRLKGQAKALNQQRNNINITNIIAADQIGRFPDANAGDALKRVPGITMQGDQGEARNIIIRGMAPQLNSVTLNGNRIPSAEGDNRNIQMDLIPSDMVQTIEVNKAVRPDMEGDAIGGSVNLITRTPNEPFRASVTAAGGMNLLTDKPIWTGAFILGGRPGNGKFGYLLAGSINRHELGSDNVEGEWENEAESPITGEDIEVDPYLGEHDIRTYYLTRVRRSLSGTVDYRFDENNTIALSGMYNWRDDWENRYRLRHRSIEPIFEDGTENIIGYEGEVRRQSKGGIDNNRIKNQRLEDQRVQNVTLSGDHLLGKLQLNWQGAYSRASEERPNERYIEYEVDEAFELETDFADSRFPTVMARNDSDVALDRFALREITEEYQFTQEEDLTFKIDLQLPVLVSNRDGFVKVGGFYRDKTKERDNNFFEYSPLSDQYETMDLVPTSDQSKDNFLAGSKYAAGPFVTREFLGELDLYNSNEIEEEDAPGEYLPGNYNASENVAAGYLLWDQNITDKFSFMAGVRVEATSIDYTGNIVVDSEELITDTTNTDNYTNWMPSIHLKYNFSRNTILRAAWTNTIARPNYYDLVPYVDIIAEDEEIFAGNANLMPTTSMNLDLMFEHYFTTVGLASAGVFYKDIQDFIYVQQSEDEATGFDFFQPTNGGSASLFGFEVAFQRQFDFLPGFWKGFGLYLNYTFISSDAKGVRNGDGEERESVDLPGTAPNMFNASLSYETKRLVLRLSLNFSDAYIDELGDDAFFDRYYDKQTFLDFNGSYAITEKFRVFAEVNNITNQPLRYYQGVADRTMQVEYYNARFNLGLKYDLIKK